MSLTEPLLTRWPGLRSRLARYLPANQFDQLRTLPDELTTLDQPGQDEVARQLIKATRSLEPLHRVLYQFMPRYLNDLDPTPGQPHGDLLEGSFIFADVTGFTALTELLARQGQARGRELLNQIMNRLFTEILDPLIASGGDLLIFAGDAALIYFPAQPNQEDVLQATRAALRMERAIAPFADFNMEFGRCSLTMSAGVERGVVYAGVVGTKERMELLVSGPGIDGAMKAEVNAEPGQVFLGEEAQAVARRHFTMAEGQVIDDLGDRLGDYEITPISRKRVRTVLFGTDLMETLRATETTLERVERLAPFLPEDMLAHLVNSDRRRQLVSEFRPVAVQFIHLVGLDSLATEQGPAPATEFFQRYFVQAQEIITRHEGVISQVDAYDRGFFFLNTFGTPKAHEGTTRYAVSAALQLSKALDQLNQEFKLSTPIRQRGGITYGLVFGGEVGAKYRRESVVVGPAVNRAARLMSKAEFGQVVLDAKIWDDIHTAFVGEELPAVKLKGIEGQVVIVNVHKIRRGARLQPLRRPLLGREAEQSALTRARAALRETNRGSAWLVHGETGIGKSSLIADLAEKAARHKLTTLVGKCQPHGKHLRLFVWTDVLTGWLDVDGQVNLEQMRQRLTDRLLALDMADAEQTLLKLLGLGQPASQKKAISEAAFENIPVKPRTKSELPPNLLTLLGEQPQPANNRKTMWQQVEEYIAGPTAIFELLEKLSKQEPLLLILEDVHWLERESRGLLKKLLARIDALPVMLVMTSREPAVEQENVSFINLSGLSDSAITQVAQRAFGAQALDGSLAEWVCSKANQNPLYAEELCHALQQADAVFLDKETGEVRWTKQAPALPLSLHELMLARLDELPLPHQQALKRAAVIGLTFEYPALRRLSKRRLTEAQLSAALEHVSRAGLIEETQPEIYRFTHPLMQEAIYTTLSFSQRQIWHTKIGRWLEEQAVEQQLELIAYHFLQGNDPIKAARYGRLAGDRARTQRAYAEALEYYEQVLSLKQAPADERAAAAESQADILSLLT